MTITDTRLLFGSAVPVQRIVKRGRDPRVIDDETRAFFTSLIAGRPADPAAAWHGQAVGLHLPEKIFAKVTGDLVISLMRLE